MRNVLWSHPWLNGTAICFLSERASLRGARYCKSWGKSLYSGVLGSAWGLMPSTSNRLIPLKHPKELKATTESLLLVSAFGRTRQQKNMGATAVFPLVEKSDNKGILSLKMHSGF